MFFVYSKIKEYLKYRNCKLISKQVIDESEESEDLDIFIEIYKLFAPDRDYEIVLNHSRLTASNYHYISINFPNSNYPELIYCPDDLKFGTDDLKFIFNKLRSIINSIKGIDAALNEDLLDSRLNSFLEKKMISKQLYSNCVDSFKFLKGEDLSDWCISGRPNLVTLSRQQSDDYIEIGEKYVDLHLKSSNGIVDSAQELNFLPGVVKSAFNLIHLRTANS